MKQYYHYSITIIIIRSPLQLGRISNYRLKTVEIWNAKTVILMSVLDTCTFEYSTAAENL